jgi:hypothetical protein
MRHCRKHAQRDLGGLDAGAGAFRRGVFCGQFVARGIWRQRVVDGHLEVSGVAL